MLYEVTRLSYRLKNAIKLLPQSYRVKPIMFSTLDDACQGLLLTTGKLLNDCHLKYVIAGGWVPILLEPNHPTLKHPGTRDVDVLLTDDDAEIAKAVRFLLGAKFRPSAKHEFQLLRDAQVQHDIFVFNVDLMHPSEAERRPQMFEDIFDLGVRDSYDPRGSRHMKSIAFKSAAIVYKENLFQTVPVTGKDFDGADYSIDIPILSASAFILSKCESVAVKKRFRDAFDIHFLLTGNHASGCARELKNLAAKFPQVEEQLSHLRQFLHDKSDQFNYNVSKYSNSTDVNAAENALSILF